MQDTEGTLQVRAERYFEEALELILSLSDESDEKEDTPPSFVSCAIELVIDRAQGAGPSEPPKEAFVKCVETGSDHPVMLQNMPSGFAFFVAVVVTLTDGTKLRSPWARTRTLPLSEMGVDCMDLVGNKRGKCKKCPCKSFRLLDEGIRHVNEPNAVATCRRCGCTAFAHAEDVIALPKKEEEKSKAPQASTAKRKAKERKEDEPAAWTESPHWCIRERDLFSQSSRLFHPDKMADKRRPWVSVGGRGRVSVCCPTVEMRQIFHEQLWNVFDSLVWPDKELVIVETYQSKPSPFFTQKAAQDDRVIYMSFPRHPGDDWTIGLKRNMCTHVASGEYVANFDDDDVYAPTYIKQMIEEMHAMKCQAITLSSWYVFDVACSKFGFVDPEAYCQNPTEKEHWLYGYGFSYVYLREDALRYPYPNKNMGEDYDFFAMLRATSGHILQGLVRRDLAEIRRVGLLYDNYGLCVHTLHPQSTSHSWAKREVPLDEVHGLDIAEIAPILNAYVNRFPCVAQKSRFIGEIQRNDRVIEIYLGNLANYRKIHITCSHSATMNEVKRKVVMKINALSSMVQQLKLYKENPWSESHKFRPDAVALSPDERISNRTAVLWGVTDAERGDKKPGDEEALEVEEEVTVTVVDFGDEGITEEVTLPHANVTQQAVLAAIVARYTKDNDDVRKAVRNFRLAIPISEGVLVACDLNDKVGKHRRFRGRGLAELAAAAAVA